MFTFKCSLFFLILSVTIMGITRTESNPKDIGKCNCDLSVGHCDLNCCCDNDCSQLDLEIFKCSQKSNFTSKQWCVPNSALFLSNTPYIITTLGDLVCVDINNTLSLNYYLSPLTDSIGINDSFISAVANFIAPQNVKSAFDLPKSDFPFNITNYVFTILPTNKINILNLPIQVGSNCRAGPPVYHYQDRSSSCLASPKALIDECNKVTISPLSLKYFLNDPKFIRKPKSLQNCLENAGSASNPFDYYSTCSSDYIIELKIRSCTDEEGSQINQCEDKLEPNLDADKCTNLIKSVSYLLRYDSSTGIMEAGLDVIFQNEININTNAKFVEQTFKTFFIPKSIKLSEFDSFQNQRLSGNPGYLRGKPILVGSTALSTGSLTYFLPNFQGKCVFDEDSSRKNVKFQENVVSECLFEPPFDKNSQNYCTDLQDAIDKIILGTDRSKRATRFAPFATSDPKDWIQIINANSNQPQISTLNGVCKSVRIGTSIIIAFALVGNVANPQPQIQYISYDWNEQTDIKIDSNRIKVSSRVIFIDVSQPPLYSQSKMARPQVTLPGDFFYPIINSSKQVMISKCLLFFFVSIFLL